jgi:hypothetical protein
MNQSEKTKIISIDGWTKIRFTICGNEKFLPSDEILDRLINFPTWQYVDIYNLDKFRIKPQLFDRDSHLLLQSISNQIVNYLFFTPLTDYESKIIQWWEEDNRDPAYIIFRKKLADYCEFIQPALPSNYKKDSIIAAVSRGEWNPADPDFRDRHKNVDWNYWRRRKREEFSLIRRFPEYGSAAASVRWVADEIGNDLYLDEYDQVNREKKWFENHRNNLFGRNGSLRKFKGTLPLELDKGMLTQCLFCYRFHRQYLGSGGKKSSLSRCCDREECKKKNHYWENNFPLNYNIKYTDIASSGMGGVELSVFDVVYADESLHFEINQADVPLSGF